jgi:hypothetical protein
MIGLITVTAGGRSAAERLADVLPYAQLYDGPAASAIPRAFAECDAIISFLAVGATVRIAAPLITGKYDDPGIVCVDEALRFAIGPRRPRGRRERAGWRASPDPRRGGGHHHGRRGSGIGGPRRVRGGPRLRLEPGSDPAPVGAADPPASGSR